MDYKLKPIHEWMIDGIDFTKEIPDWIDPRDPEWMNKDLNRKPMPNWIQELSDWSMNTGNYKKIDELLDLRFGDRYNTPWNTDEINKFKYGEMYKGIEKVKPSKQSLIAKYLKAINPREVFHRDPEFIFDKFDLSKAGIKKDGTRYSLNWGPGAYVSTENDPSLNKFYGDKVSRFFINPESKLVTPRTKNLANIYSHPYFKEEVRHGPKFQKYLQKKGYAGVYDDWENVLYNPDKDLLPANNRLQRFINRFFNNSAIRYGGKILNKISTPLMILEGIGLNQPVGQGSDQPPIYPVNGMLKGYITNKY
jgi:hypothetical protein